MPFALYATRYVLFCPGAILDVTLCFIKLKILLPPTQDKQRSKEQRPADTVCRAAPCVAAEGVTPWMSTPNPGCSRQTLPSESFCAD